jgi:hypothetical protein
MQFLGGTQLVLCSNNTSNLMYYNIKESVNSVHVNQQ